MDSFVSRTIPILQSLQSGSVGSALASYVGDRVCVMFVAGSINCVVMFNSLQALRWGAPLVWCLDDPLVQVKVAAVIFAAASAVARGTGRADALVSARCVLYHSAFDCFPDHPGVVADFVVVTL